MTRAGRMVAGGVAMAAIAWGAAILSASPVYRSIPEDAGVLKISFSHGAERSCRDLTDAELANLPPNMRKRTVCDRRRPPVRFALDIDGETRIDTELPPTGIAGDGPSRIYERIVLPAGDYDIAVRLRDTGRAEGFDHEAARRLTMSPALNAVIDFRADRGGFQFHFGAPEDGGGGDDGS